MSVANETNPLEMSDEDFSKLNSPPVAEAAGEVVVEEPEVKEAVVDEPVIEAGEGTGTETNVSEADGGDATDDGASSSGAESETKTTEVVTEEPKPVVEPTGSEPKVEAAPVVVEAGTYTAPTNEVAQEIVKKLMSPIKANGKTIELKSPEEAMQLIQMGANYTRKLQELSPHRKTLMTLQNNNIDEAKLNFLIDLDKKNPDAIKKLIKDSGIDPLEIDTSAELNYSAGNHTPSDKAVEFSTVVTEISANSAGKDTLMTVDKWDEASKDALWESPELLRNIHEQRESGVFNLINSEVERRTTLGTIPPNTPFLEAYKIVGDEMVAAMNQGQSSTTIASKAEPVAIETRAAAPKATVKDSDKASAASPTSSTKAAVVAPKNPFAMSDDEILKQFENRL